jgi:predicted transcriptional regulator
MLTIKLDGAIEDRLKRVADSEGTEPQVLARRVLEENLPEPDDKTLAVLAEWERENATSDPVELQRRQEEGEAFMQNLARNRLESQGL